MSHLSIGKLVSFDRLVELYRKYKKEYDEATDVFIKAENEVYLSDISYFCHVRGGFNYYKKVVEAANAKDNDILGADDDDIAAVIADINKRRNIK